MKRLRPVPQQPSDLITYTFSPAKLIQARIELFSLLPPKPICFLGDSLIEGFPLQEALSNYQIANRGISGATTEDILNMLPLIIRQKPEQVFLMIGVNDIFKEQAPELVFQRARQIVYTLRAEGIRVHVMSVLPATGYEKAIVAFNRLLSTLGSFIDLYPLFLKDGALNPEYTFDGVHLTGKGYIVWRDAVKGFIQ